MKALKIFAACAAFACAAIAVPAHATLTTYTNLASFQAASGLTTIETFSSAAVGTSTANYAGAFNGFALSSTANGDYSGIATATIATFGDNSSIPASFSGQKFYGWGDSSGNGNVGPTTLFTFNHAVTAFAFDWFNTDGTDVYSVTVNNLTQNVFATSSNGFFGVVASNNETFTNASIQTASYGGYISTEGLDNVRVSAVPEPTGIALFGIALFGFVAARRRSRAK